MGKSSRPAPCHPHRRHKAKGLCGTCYESRRVAASPAVRAYIAKYARVRHLRIKFGLSEDQYDRMLQEQGGGCKLCGETSSGRGRLHVDHNHRTGRVRGLLCWTCNYRIVGVLDRTPDMMKKLTEYLTNE